MTENEYTKALVWFNQANWNPNIQEIKTIRRALEMASDPAFVRVPVEPDSEFLSCYMKIMRLGNGGNAKRHIKGVIAASQTAAEDSHD